MLTERQRLLVHAHRLWDLGLTMVAFVASYFVKKYLLPLPFRGLTIAPNYYVILLMVVIIWYVLIYRLGLHEHFETQPLSKILWNVIKIVGLGLLLLALGLYIFKIRDVSRIMIGLFGVFDLTLLIFSKLAVHRVLTYYQIKGLAVNNVIIIGSRERAKDFIEAVRRQVARDIDIIGCLETERQRLGVEVKEGVGVIGTLEDLPAILKERVVDGVVFAMPLNKIDKAHEYIALAEDMGVRIRVIPDWQIHALMYRPRIATIVLESFAGIPVMTLTSTSRDDEALLIKTALDFAAAAMGLIVLSPLFVFIAGAIKLFSRGPVFFKQERSGLYGRRFMFYKFRTMSADAETRKEELKALNEADGPAFKIKKDPRIIPFIGTFLRKTSLDELPQLLNVLKGEMSLVGPRPPVPSEVKQYEDNWRRRLSMKPGLTCLWQILPNRNETDFDEWMLLDLEYIDRWSLWLDFRILFQTIRAVLSGQGR